MIQNVTISVSKLIKTVQENRKKHKETYKKACEGYLEALKDFTKERAEKVAQCKTVEETDAVFSASERPDRPICYLEDYDNAIALLEHETRDTIVLDASTFSQLVLDKWSWRGNFDSVSTSNIQYGVLKKVN